MPDIAKVIVFSVVSYLYLFLIAKLLGKKQIAQLSFIDYVVGISIGSIAAEMATETQQPFYHYLIAMGIFFLFDLLVTLISRKSAMLKKIVNGKPTLLIEDGKINYSSLKKSKLSIDELAGLARDKGYFDFNDIAFAIFETSGKLSILPKAAKQPVVNENMDIRLAPASLTEYLVIDGKLCKDSLTSNNYTEDWVLDRLRIKSSEELDNILVASYDSEKDTFNVQYKDQLPPQD